ILKDLGSFQMHPTLIKFLFLVKASLIVCLVNGQSTSKPNIIVYLADDMGYLDASVYGAKVVQTPVLERLSFEGMTFKNAFVTSPACAPSRASLLTGLMPARNGAETNHSFPAKDVPYLIQNFKKSGYKVFAFGKVAHYKGNKKCGFDHHNDQQINLYQNIKAYFDTIAITSPVVLFIGDRRPHVRWTEELFYAPEQVDLPSYFIDTKPTREHRSRYYTDITGLDSEMGHVLHYLNGKFGENTITLFTSDHGAQWPFGKWNLYDAGIRTPLVIRWPGKIAPNTSTDAMVSWIDILPTLLDLANLEAADSLDGKSFKSILFEEEDQFRTIIYTTHTGDGKFNIYPIRSIRTDEYKLIYNLEPNAYHSNHSDINRKDGAGKYWDSWNEEESKDPRAAYIIRKYYQRPDWEFYDLRVDQEEQQNLIDEPSYQEVIAELKTQLKQWMKDHNDDGKTHLKPYPLSGKRPDLSFIKK
ncbi:MAG: sulfatase, partial [Bacteroidota bacterium]